MIVPTNFSAEQQASRYTITVTANIQLRDVRKTPCLWSNPSISSPRGIRRDERASRTIRRFVDPISFLQPGIQRPRTRQQRVLALGRERHSGSLLIAGRVSPLTFASRSPPAKSARSTFLSAPDEAAKIALAGEFLELVDADLRAFNVDRLYGGETTGAAVVDAARTLPMMVPRRVVLLVHAERLLNPKKESDATARDLESLAEYVKAPVDTCCLVLVAEAVDKRRSLTRLLLSRAHRRRVQRTWRRGRGRQVG